MERSGGRIQTCAGAEPKQRCCARTVRSLALMPGRTDEALAWLLRSRELDPLGFSGVTNGWILFHARRYDDAIREFKTVSATYPDHWYLGFALIARGKSDEAIPVLESALSNNNGSPAIMGGLIRAYAHTGRRADALRLLDGLKRKQQKG